MIFFLPSPAMEDIKFQGITLRLTLLRRGRSLLLKADMQWRVVRIDNSSLLFGSQCSFLV